MMNYSISEIEEMIEKEKFLPEIKGRVEILLSAINDWPDPLVNLNEYDLAVQQLIMNTATKENIEIALKHLDISKYAWEAESLSSLIEVFDFFKKDTSLKEIIDIVLQPQSPDSPGNYPCYP